MMESSCNLSLRSWQSLSLQRPSHQSLQWANSRQAAAKINKRELKSGGFDDNIKTVSRKNQIICNMTWLSDLWRSQNIRSCTINNSAATAQWHNLLCSLLDTAASRHRVTDRPAASQLASDKPSPVVLEKVPSEGS